MRPSQRRKLEQANGAEGGSEAGDGGADKQLGADNKLTAAQQGRKRAAGNADAAPASRRRRSASPVASIEEDPIESADEESGDDAEERGGRQPAAAAQAADEDSWDDGEELQEQQRKPQRQSGRARRSARQRQALVESDSGSEEQEERGGSRRPALQAAAAARTNYKDTAEEQQSEEEEEEEEGERGSGRRRPRRAAAAARPNYRDTAEDGEEQEEEEEEEPGSEAQPTEEVEEDEEESEEGSESEEEEEEEPAPRRTRAVAQRPATRGGGKSGAPAGARRSERSRARVNYNVDAMEVDIEEELVSSSEGEAEEESEEENDESQPARRPTRHAAKAAKKNIRQQTGGGKRRKQPKRAAAPAKRRAVIEESDDDEDEDGFQDDRRRRSGSSNGSEDAGSDSEGGGSQSEGSGEDESEDEEGAELDASQVEKILACRLAADGSGEEFRCKLADQSYRKACWLPYDVLAADRLQLLRNFQKKLAAGEVDPYGDLEEGIKPDWLEVDRIIAKRVRTGRPVYLVKWRDLGYSECTWERERDLQGDEAHIERFERFNMQPEEEEEEPGERELDTSLVPDFCNGRQLRDYQQVSLEWNINNWALRRNCILGDEMGLGKTAQSISVLAYQRQYGGTRGPFLVIAPLTTLGHWQREIETWTDMNCVVYAGGAADKHMIQKHDLFFSGSSDRRQRRRVVKPNVVLAPYEVVLKDKSLFSDIYWETVIIDEAHRMKSTSSSTRAVIAGMQIEWLLLLTGTPVQNNMRELFGILNLLDSEKFGDEEEFLERFGDERNGMTPDQVRALQEVLRPILLRRMKEDVETLPEKEEVIIWVELTPAQRAYYKAIFENEIGTLLAGASAKNMPNLRNLAMELRKVCCHPYLCNGLEEDIQRRKLEAGVEAGELEQLVGASGKMVLLHKLLPKLRREGRKVLIFSQFKMMLDVLEDYLRLAGHPCERIDGSTASRDRQAAIDRFSKEGSDGFVFLLSTRAGGQGITLTAADTCIIYDSDWNPQNDLQAMARCHRIGQDKEVTIYRLVSKNTYEQNVFEISSRKYGLDEAILGNLGAGGGSETSSGAGGGGNPEEDSRKIADLLKHGAHCLHAMDAANEQSGAFAAEGIDEILQGRTEKRQIGGRAGNTFSVATFAVGPSTVSEGGPDDRSYWTTLLPGAVEEHEKMQAAKRAPVILAPRARKQVDYKGQLTGRVSRQVSQADDDDDEYVVGSAEQEEDEDLVMPKGKKAKKGGKKEGGLDYKRWTHGEISEFLHRLVQMGEGRTDRVKEEAQLTDRSLEECSQLEAGVLQALEQAGKLQAAHEAEAAAQKAEQLRADMERLHQLLPGTAAATGAAGGGSDAGAAAAAGGPAAAGGAEEGDGQQSKQDKSKKAKDRSVAEGLAAWLEAEMGDASPVVAHALRTKTFLDFANAQPSKTLQALRHRKLLSTWVERLQEEMAAAAANERSPEGSHARLTMPWLKGKTPHGWSGRGGWHEADTRSLMLALHELGWVARKGRMQSEVLEAILTDERFGFHKRVQRRQEAHASPAKPAQAAAGQAEQAQPGAGPEAMDIEGQQQQGPQQVAAEPAVGAAAAAAPAASPQASPSKVPHGPRVLDEKEWATLAKGLATFINSVLIPALEQPAPRHGSASRPVAVPAGGLGLHRVDSAHGSSNDLHRLGQKQQQQQRPLAKQAAANAAAAAAAAGVDGAEGIGHSSDATPLGAGAAGKGKGPVPAVAAGYTNPLTASGMDGPGGSGSKPGGSGGGKPKLALHPSTGPKGAKGKTQQSIVGFFSKKAAPAAATAAAAVGAQDSPTGHKENQQQAQRAQQQQAAAGGSGKAPGSDDVIVVE